MKTVLFSAAHAGFNLGNVPLGGGAAICARLTEEWNRTRPFPLDVLGPALLSQNSPTHKDLVHYSELEYARFCRQFEQAVTKRILTSDPASTVVLANDVSEGPDFQRLAERGFPVFTIYHVDVVDYFVRFYLGSRVSPERTTGVYRKLTHWRLSGLVPDVLKLVWQKQEASVRYSRGLIVPSAYMKDVLLRCYPDLDARKVHVMPWGIWSAPTPERSNTPQKGPFKLLMLSRISPEKGQHRLLEALALWEREADYPQPGVEVRLSGEAAYMMGKRYEKRLRKLAHRLRKTRVHFVGYAADGKKEDLFKKSELYVFPSIHESYGITLMEAMHSGLAVLTTPSYGAREIFQPGSGEMTSPGPENEVPRKLMEALRGLWKSREALPQMGARGASWAAGQRFSDTASRLAALLASQ